MAPTVSKKATQPKARSVSRHSTPLTEKSPTPTPGAATPVSIAASNPALPKETLYLKTLTSALISTDSSIEQLIEKSSTSLAKQGDPPTGRDLRALGETISLTINKFMGKRGEVCDRSMRQLVQRRKERAQAEEEQEAARAEEERVKVKREEDERRKEKKALSRKRSHDEMDVDGESQDRKEQRESLPSVGAHGLARQDGVNVHQGELTVTCCLGTSCCCLHHNTPLHFTLNHPAISHLIHTQFLIRAHQHTSPRATSHSFHTTSTSEHQLTTCNHAFRCSRSAFTAGPARYYCAGGPGCCHFTGRLGCLAT